MKLETTDIDFSPNDGCPPMKIEGEPDDMVLRGFYPYEFWLGAEQPDPPRREFVFESINFVGPFCAPVLTVSPGKVRLGDCTILGGGDAWGRHEAMLARLRADLVEADAVIARAFPNATERTVQSDTWRAIQRHRARADLAPSAPEAPHGTP